MISFPAPSALNDPFEMQPFYESLSLDPKVRRQLTTENAGDALKEELAKALPNVPKEIQDLLKGKEEFIDQFADIIAPFAVEFSPIILDSATEALGNGIYQGLNKNVGVLSLTEKRDDLLMWAHYADHHRGFVIGFDSKHSFFDQRLNEKDDFRHLRPVTYTETRPTVQFARDDELAAVLLTKSSEWSYEREWRMLLPLALQNKEISVQGNRIPLFEFPSDAVMEIIFGCRINEDTRKEIERFIFADLRYERARVFRAKLNKQYYRLDLLERERL